MSDELISVHDKLKTYLELMKSNSKTSIPDDIESIVEQVKFEVITQGRNKFHTESMKYFAAVDNKYIKLTSAEKNIIFKTIKENYETKFSKAIQTLQKSRDDIENFKELNIKELDSLTNINKRAKTKSSSEYISTSAIDDIFRKKLEKSNNFNEHKEIYLNAKKIPYIAERFSEFFEKDDWKSIVLNLNDFYQFIEDNKVKLQKTSTPLQDLVEKLVGQKKVNIVDFYSDENVNKHLSEVSINDIKNELKDYKDKEIEIE